MNNQLVVTWGNDLLNIPPTPDTTFILAQNISGQGELGIMPTATRVLPVNNQFASVFLSDVRRKVSLLREIRYHIHNIRRIVSLDPMFGEL